MQRRGKPMINCKRNEAASFLETIKYRVSTALNGAEDRLVTKASYFVERKGAEEGMAFRFCDHLDSKGEIDRMFSDFLVEIHTLVKRLRKEAICLACNRAGAKEASLSESYTGNGLPPTLLANIESALRTFLLIKNSRVLTTAKRLRKIVCEYRKAIEDAITGSLQKGQGPVALAGKVIKNLREVRDGKMPHNGPNCHYAAYRLAYTEISMAYRMAEQERYSRMEDVVGMRIRTSGNSSKKHDMCEALAGDYPKDFKWTGWHPMCHCYAVPIFRTKRVHDDANDGKDTVNEVPENFTKWVKDNSEKIALAEKRGTLPYFLADNKKAWSMTAKAVGGGYRGYVSLTSEFGGKRGRKDPAKSVEFADFKLSHAQNENLADIVNALGIDIKGLQPMTFQKADGLAPNIMQVISPTADYLNNCQSCVLSMELRARGLDVCAAPFDMNNKLQQKLARNMSRSLAVENRVSPTPFNDTKEFLNHLERVITKQDGRYFIGWDNQSRTADGHVTYGIVRDGEFTLYDPQTGCLRSLSDVRNCCMSIESHDRLLAEVLRVDDKLLDTPTAASCVRPISRKY